MVNSYGLFFSTSFVNHSCCYSTSACAATSLHFSSSFKLQNELRVRSGSYSRLGSVFATTSTTWHQAVPSDSFSETTSLQKGKDNVGWNPVPTDYMYVMKCPEGEGGNFSDGELQPFGNIQLIPSACVLNYGQAVIEDLKAYKKEDDSILLFRPEEHGLRMKIGANRLCMPAPTIEQFLEAVKDIILTNRRWIPPPDKGFLRIRALLMGSGAVLSLTPAPEFTFLIHVAPVSDYFEEGLKPINLVVENEFHRATPGGVGDINAISNYAAILKAQATAKANGFSDVLYLDCIHNRYLEEVSTANIFIVKDKTISTPELRGTILPGITRKSIIDIACGQGFQVEERLLSVEELFDADEVFCTETVSGLLPVGSITCLDKRSITGIEKQLYKVSSRVSFWMEDFWHIDRVPLATKDRCSILA